MDGWTRYAVFLMIVAKMPGERRFQTGVVTGIIGALAVASLVNDNQVQQARRAIAWYNVHSQIEDVKALGRAVDALDPADMLETAATRTK